MPNRVVVVGASAAGLTAAETCAGAATTAHSAAGLRTAALGSRSCQPPRLVSIYRERPFAIDVLTRFQCGEHKLEVMSDSDADRYDIDVVRLDQSVSVGAGPHGQRLGREPRRAAGATRAMLGKAEPS
jgi:hypothetical protein